MGVILSIVFTLRLLSQDGGREPCGVICLTRVKQEGQVTMWGMTDSPPARPVTSRAEQARRTRARILTAALRLFADKGYDATSLQDIADELGMTKQAVYYHFKGKGQILSGLAEPARQGMDDLMARAQDTPLGPERVDTLIGGLVDLLLARRDVLRIMSQQPALRQDMQSALGAEHVVEALTEGLFGPQPTPDQRFAVYASAALGRGIQALGDLPEAELRGVLERALRRIAAVE
jgi:AcrR family transcriptional regulator